jgi:hypothetical protein
MPDPITLATAAVAFLSPYLADAAKGAAGKLGEATVEGGKKLLSWLREKLSPEDGKDLDRLAADPANSDRQATLRVSLAEALAANPGLQPELDALLRTLPTFAATQSMNQVGDGNTGAQASGQNININIGRA